MLKPLHILLISSLLTITACTTDFIEPETTTSVITVAQGEIPEPQPEAPEGMHDYHECGIDFWISDTLNITPNPFYEMDMDGDGENDFGIDFIGSGSHFGFESSASIYMATAPLRIFTDTSGFHPQLELCSLDTALLSQAGSAKLRTYEQSSSPQEELPDGTWVWSDHLVEQGDWDTYTNQKIIGIKQNKLWWVTISNQSPNSAPMVINWGIQQ